MWEGIAKVGVRSVITVLHRSQCSAAMTGQRCPARHSCRSVRPSPVCCRLRIASWCAILARRRGTVLSGGRGTILAWRRGAILRGRGTILPRRRLRWRCCSRSSRWWTRHPPQRRRRPAWPLQDGELPQHVAQQLHCRHQGVLLATHLQGRMQVEMGWRSWAGGEGQLGNALASHQDLQWCAASAAGLPACLPLLARPAPPRPAAPPQ